jgi:hypothetical protein
MVHWSILTTHLFILQMFELLILDHVTDIHLIMVCTHQLGRNGYQRL